MHTANPKPINTSANQLRAQSNVFLGLVSLDLLYVIDQVLVIPILLTFFYMTLRRTNKSIITHATILGVIGIIAILPANTSVNMLHLSNQYALATTDAQRSLYLAAGEAMLATLTGTSYHIYIILGVTAFIAISVIMLQDKTFSKSISYTGIMSNIFTLGLYVPVIGILILLLSLIFFEASVILLALRLFQLGKEHKRRAQTFD